MPDGGELLRGRHGRAYGHFPVYLPGVARNDGRPVFQGLPYTVVSLADSRRSQYYYEPVVHPSWLRKRQGAILRLPRLRRISPLRPRRHPHPRPCPHHRHEKLLNQERISNYQVSDSGQIQNLDRQILLSKNP